VTVPEVVVVGFDSAWTDSPDRPGAICAAHFRGAECLVFEPPRLASFADGLSFIGRVERPDVPLLVALDQPTIVRNETGSRPADKVAASLMGWLGGGVQPASRSRVGMFDGSAPIWRFLADLGAAQSPEEARSAGLGRHLIEVFPALALAAFDPAFYGRNLGPRYNPERRKTFSIGVWRAVLRVVAEESQRLGCHEAAEWVGRLDVERARKQDQDRLDSLICLLVGLRWRLEPRARSVMLGCLDHGYMIAPTAPLMHQRLSRAASLRGAPVDSIVPSARIRA
jgi:predicted RNase H-like nuclease